MLPWARFLYRDHTFIDLSLQGSSNAPSSIYLNYAWMKLNREQKFLDSCHKKCGIRIDCEKVFVQLANVEIARYKNFLLEPHRIN